MNTIENQKLEEGDKSYSGIGSLVSNNATKESTDIVKINDSLTDKIIKISIITMFVLSIMGIFILFIKNSPTDDIFNKVN